MSHLIDTDWVVDYLKGRAPAVALLTGLFAQGLALSVITFAETYEGIYYGSDPKGNEASFRRFLAGVRVLPVTRTIGRRFALLRGQLRQQGQLLAQPDLLIAATAIAHDLTLVTGNAAHFRRVPGLNLYPVQP